MNNNNIEVLAKAINTAKGLFDRELRARGTCKVYDFLPVITQNSVYSWSDNPLIGIFQKQYIIQAALIELQEDYRVLAQSGKDVKLDREDQKMLILSPVTVALVDHESIEEITDTQKAVEDAAASVVLEHYRDYERFFSATEDSISELLESFWAKFNAYEEKDIAYKILGVESGSSLREINEAYRNLISLHHPDKGGDAEEFIKIRQAFESLKKHHC